MKFKSLSLENFRQFYDTNIIKFATDEHKNVTLIYGANGSGKTTILNAMTWVFYGKFTSDFEHPSRLINERKWDEVKIGSTVVANVSIEFEHEDRNYTASKFLNIKKTESNTIENAKEGSLNVEYIDVDGEFSRAPNPKDLLDRLLPQRLHNFFFFNGERIDALAKETAYSEIQDAIKTILGLEVVDRSIKHLNSKVKHHFNQKWAEEGTEELRSAQKKLEELEENVHVKQEELKREKSNLSALKEDQLVLRQRLKDLDQTREIEGRIENLEADSDYLKNQLKDIKNDIANLCSAMGYLAFTPKIIKESLRILEDAYRKGDIPSRIKRRFVDELLEEQECICGRPLIPDEDAYNSVLKWRTAAGLEDVEEAALRSKAASDNFKEQRLTFFQELRKFQGSNENIRRRKNNTEGELSEKKKELKDILEELGSSNKSELDGENYEDLKERYDTIENSIGETNRKLGSIDREIQNFSEQIVKVKGKKEQLEVKSVKEELAKRRVRVLDESIGVFQTLYDLRWKEVRRQLQEKISKIYQDISFKSYRPILTEDYQLILKKEIGSSDQTVAKSTGENQVLSLSFIGSLVDYARQVFRQATPKDILSFLSFRGGIYPLVIDSPFGTLDLDYRASIAEGMPRLSPQVILMVSKSQGTGVVEEKLFPRIGKAYTLVFFTTKEDYEKEPLSWNGRSFPYVEKSDNEYEFAKIEEITYA